MTNYGITIGNAVLTGRIEENVFVSGWEVAETDIVPDNYPKFKGDLVPLNYRLEHKGCWREFCNITALDKLFYGEGEAFGMGKNARTTPLEEEHLAEVSQALISYKIAFKDTTPGYGPYQDRNLARLIWLEYWMAWALESCEYPAIEIR